MVIAGGGETPGSITVDNGQALLQEGSSFLVSLQQAFTLPNDALHLNFDLIVRPGFDRSATGMPDAFEVHLLDDSSQSVVPTWSPLATSFFNIQEDLTQNVATGVSVTPIDGGGFPAFHVSVDLTGVAAPVHVTLYVDLIGADEDTGSGVRVDNFVVARRSDPPTCNAGGPYTAECQGRITSVPLDGHGSTDPGGAALSYLWTVDCPAANFDDPTSPTPVLRTASPNCTVTLQVDNGFGGVSTCTTTVTLTDTTPPTIACPGLYVVETTNPAGIPVGNLPMLAAAVDVCDNAVAITSDVPATGFFPIGDTVVTFAATDDAGNRSTCATTVRVVLSPGGGTDPCANDTTPPEIVCLGQIEVIAENDVPVDQVVLQVQAADNCDSSVTVTDDRPATAYSFAAGTTVVTFTATDNAGNTATCRSEVVIIDRQAALARAGLGGGQDRVYVDQQTTRTEIVPGCGATSCGALGLMTLLPCAAGIGAMKLGLRMRRGRCPHDRQ